MPVKINVRSAEYHAANDSRFDAAVRRLAPIINQLREDPARRSTRKLADRLNDRGEHAPNGKPITPSTIAPIIGSARLHELDGGDWPPSIVTSNRNSEAV
jgi:hypothetical protein